MRIIKIPSKTTMNNPSLNMMWNNEIDIWCKEQGLIKNKDYKCFYMSGAKEYHVTFNEEHESMASLLVMKWA